jgi:predicted ATP-dependent protease
LTSFSGIAAVIEYAVRQSNHQDRISTSLTKHVADVVREAHFWATEHNYPIITREVVDRTIREKIYRQNLVEDKIQRNIQEGSLLLNLEGKVVGQVNALSVLEIGGYSFGFPDRLTATTSLGKSGLLQIHF